MKTQPALGPKGLIVCTSVTQILRLAHTCTAVQTTQYGIVLIVRCDSQHFYVEFLRCSVYCAMVSEGLQPLKLNVCGAMAEWVKFDTDLWDTDGFSSANFFFSPSTGFIPKPIGIASAVQKGPSWASNMRQKNSKVSSFCEWRQTNFSGKIEEKALPLDEFLRKLVSCTLQSQALLFKKKLDLH